MSMSDEWEVVRFDVPADAGWTTIGYTLKPLGEGRWLTTVRVNGILVWAETEKA